MLRFGVLVVLILTADAVFAQTPLALIDESPPGAPLSFSGTATGPGDPQNPLRFHVSAKNVSEKDIVLRVLRIDVIRPSQPNGPRSLVRSDEFLFGANLFPAHSIDTIDAAEYTPYEQPSASEVQIAPVFIQFADGSSWGDPSEGKEALLERDLTLKRLAELARTYQTEGAVQLGTALMKEPPNEVISGLQKSYRTKEDAERIMKSINQSLQNAELHLQKMQKHLNN